MILLRNKMLKRCIAIGTVVSVNPAEGRASAWKTIVMMSFQNGKRCFEAPISFWNSRDKSKPQMADRAMQLKIDEKILCILAQAQDSTEMSCLAFARKEGLFTFNDGIKDYYVGMGYIKHAADNNGVFKVAIPRHYKSEVIWSVAGFFGSKAQKASAVADIGRRVVFISDTKHYWPLKDGTPAWKYVGQALFVIKDNDWENVIISMGPYSQSPKPLATVVDESGFKEDIQTWLKYVAEQYEPRNKNEWHQKKAIEDYIKSVA